jgi:Tfp pilus assembly protein PilN
MFGFGKGRRELNLIPEEEQKLRTKKIRVITLVIIGLVFGVQVLIFVVVVALEQTEKGTRDSLSQDLAAKNSQWQQISGPAEQIKVTKNKLSSYNAFLTSHEDPNSKISKIQKVIPEGIILTSLSIVEKNKVNLGGKAANPEVLYQLHNVLQASEKDFDLVTLDAIDKVVEGDYTFIINLTLK